MAATTQEALHSLEWQPSYELTPEEIHELTNSLLYDHPPTDKSGQFVCYMVNGTQPHSNLARAVEVKVFEESFGNTPEVMKEEYGPYEDSSRFFMVIDREEALPVGALRVIEHSDQGLKTLIDIEQSPLAISQQTLVNHHNLSDPNKCWDVGTLAVLPPYRGEKTDHMVSTTLYRNLYAEAMEEGVEHFVSILDEHAYNNLKLLGVAFEPVMDSDFFSYLGSAKSLAVHGYVQEFFNKMTEYKKSLSPAVHDLLAPYMGRLMFGEGVSTAHAIE